MLRSRWSRSRFKTRSMTPAEAVGPLLRIVGGRQDAATSTPSSPRSGFNLAQMVIPVFLLAARSGIPLAFSVTHLLPGYALGFLVGSLGLVRLAVRLARRRRSARTSPRTFTGTTFRRSSHTRYRSCCRCICRRTTRISAWEIGAAAVAWTGIIKLAAAPFAGRDPARSFPRRPR